MRSATAGNAVLRHLELCAQTGNAGQSEDLAAAVYLIQSGADISVTCARGNALSCAAFHGQAEAVGAVIGRLASSNAVAQLNAQNASGCSALMFAANNGHKDVAALLLASGADRHLTDKLGCTAADRAKKKGHHEIAAMIENPETCEQCSRAAAQVSVYRLFVLCQVTDPSHFLWQCNDSWLSSLDTAVLNATALCNGRQMSALFVAVCGRNVVMLRKLIAAEADVNATTMMPMAGQEYNLSVLSMVWIVMFETLNKPAKLKDRNCDEVVLFSDYVSIAQILIAAGADVRTKRGVPDFLMQQATSPLAIPWLLALTVHENFKADAAPELAAVLHSSLLQLTRAMIEAGADANGWANEKVSLEGIRAPKLAVTIFGGMKEWTDLLLEARADVNATVHTGEVELPLLGQAFSRGNFEAARILLSAGADVNLKISYQNHGCWYEQPLWFFPQKKHSLKGDDYYRLIRMAMNVGTDANVICKTYTGDCFPPLKFAVDEGDPRLISLLIDCHADVNATINRVDGFERLCHYAIERENIECVAVLVHARANLNNFSRFPGFQQTPLGAAIKKCNYEIVRLLLDAKADITHVLTVQLDGDVDFDARVCAEKVMEELQHDLAKYRCLVRIRALLSAYQAPPAATAASSRLYDFVIQSAFGCGNSCFRFYMDNQENLTTSDLKKRIRREALLKCYIDFLVAPHLLVLVHNACIIHDSLPMSHVFSTDVTSKITCVVLTSTASQDALHENLQRELEESRRYVSVQTQVQRLREQMSQADKKGDFQAVGRYNIQVRQLLLDNQTPEWILQERLLRTAENNSLAHGHLHIGEKRVKVKIELERGNLEDARQIQMEIVQFHKMVENKADLPRSLVDLSEILRSLAQLDGAEAACVEAVDLLKQLHGETHPETLRVTGFYVGILIEMRKLRDADTLLTSWFKASQRLLGNNHPQTRSCNYALQYFRRAHQIIWSDRLTASPMSLEPPPARTGFSGCDIAAHDGMHQSALPHASIPDVFNDGSRVCIEGLHDKPELNGRCGTILGVYNETRGRWTVELDVAGPSRPLRVSIRPVNLKVTSENDAISEQIKHFCGAGFSRLHVLQCLAASKCHPDIAREYLANGLPDHLQKQYVYGHLISKMWTQWFITFRASVEAHRASPTPSTTTPSTSPHTTAPIGFNRAVHWIDDLGLLRPKTVDYLMQCPKGTDMKACPALEEGCFVCSDRKSVGGLKCDSCCSYGVCKKCISILQDNQASAPRSADFPIFGVSLSFLKAFRSRWAAVYERWSTSQVVKMLIKPLTCISRRSVCDDLIDVQSSDVGHATVFLSHVWNQPFCDTLDAFIELADSWPPSSSVFAWIDIFSASQHASADDLTSDWWMAAFKQAISRMGRVVMVMQPWDRPVALSRGWCMFELFSCVSTGGRLEVALPPSERVRFFQRDVTSRALFFQSLPELMNSKQAQFSREEDKKSILSNIESTVGFAAMDATLLQSVEAWYIPQFQLMAASASAFVDGFQKQAETFFQLAYLQYIRGDFSAAQSTCQHCLDLLENAKSHVSQNSISSERPGIIQAQILMMNSLHMQGKFQEARLHHFMLLNYLQVDSRAEPVPPRYDEETGTMLSDQVYQSTKKIRLRKKYLDAVAGNFSFVQCWRTLELHTKLPYCALGIPVELAKTEDLSRAWAAKQILGQEQALLAAASAASLLRDETFLMNYALDRHLNKFQGKRSKSLRLMHELIDIVQNDKEVSYQDIAGPIVTVTHAFFSKITHRSTYCPRSHSSVEHLNHFVTKILGTSTPNDGGVKSFDKDREDRSGNDSDSLRSTEGEMGSEISDKENDLEGYLDENDQFNAEDSLFRAAESGFVHVVQDLLQHKANVNTTNGALNMTPLHAAAACGHAEVVRLLVKCNANVNSVTTESIIDRSQRTPLILACCNGEVSIVRILVDAKADVNLVGASAPTPDGSRLAMSPMFCAMMSSEANCDLIIRLLIEAKADVAARVEPLPRTKFEAMAASTLAVNASDDDAGADVIRVKQFNDDAGQPVRYQGTHYVYVGDESHHPADSTIEFLGDGRSNKTLTVSHGRGPVKQEEDESIQGIRFLEATALHVAVLRRRFDVCSLLIDNKADPNALASFKSSGTSFSQCSALASAMVIEAEDFIRPLLDAKADPNCAFSMSSETEEMQKVTALCYSILKQQTGVLMLLIDGKADPNALVSMKSPSDAAFSQYSALALAVLLQSEISEDVIRPLLDAKADPNAISLQNVDWANEMNAFMHTKSLKTADAAVLAIPLVIYALSMGNLPIVRCLVEAKADLNTTDSVLLSNVYQHALDKNMHEIAAYLRSSGLFSEPKASHVALELPASDDILKSLLHSAGATSALSQFEAAGIYDHCLESLSGFTSTHLNEAFGLSLEQAEQFSALLQHHLTVQFLDKEADHKRRVVESAGYDYIVFESLDRRSQEEVLSSIERQLASRAPPPSSS